MGTFCVYKHTSPNGKVYIGITCKKPEYRWNHGKAYWQNTHFSNAISLYGWENFKHEVLYSGLTKEDACVKEKELISKYRSNEFCYGYNRSTGGENPAEGVKQTEESIQKRVLANTGKKRTAETCKAISDAKRGRANGCKGKLGKDSMQAGIVLQIDEPTKKVIATYYGYGEMCRKTGYSKTPVLETVKGKRKRAYGYLWQYKKRGDINVAI